VTDTKSSMDLSFLLRRPNSDSLDGGSYVYSIFALSVTVCLCL